jgi:cytochrome b
MAGDRQPTVRVWDGPLRVWHWAFAACLAGGLATGLSGDIGLIDWHMRFGYGVLALLLFRFGWSIWGGYHARWSSFRITPARIAGFLRGRPADGARTAPGVALALGLFAAAAVQASAGLFTSDFIFTDGPLVKYASGDTVDLLSAVHHRVFWVILALVACHLAAHVVYALRRDPTPLAMFTGRKPAPVGETPHFWGRALVTAILVALLAWLGSSLV